MLLTNSQNNIGRSAIDASLKHSDYDILTPKNSFREFDKVFGPTLTYSSADNLFYYIGYEDYPKPSSGEEEIIDNIINIDLGDSSFHKHNVLKRGNVSISPAENHNSSFNGSAKFNGKEDYLEVVGAQDAFTSISSSYGGAFTLEFWIKPTNLDDDSSLYQTVVSVGAKDFNDNKGFHENASPFEVDLDVSLGTSDIGGWTKGKLFVKAYPGHWSNWGEGKGANIVLDLESSTTLQENTWYHVAITREDPSNIDNNQSEVRLYINGNKEATYNWTNALGIGYHHGDGLGNKLKSIVKNLPIYIGVQGQINVQNSSVNSDGILSPINFYGHYEGYLNELRISRTVRYTGNSFSVPSLPFSTASSGGYSSDVKLLVQSFRETQDSTNIIDKSPSNHSITNTNVIHDLEHEQWGVNSSSGYDKSKFKFTHDTNLRIPHSDEFNFKYRTTRIDTWVFNPNDSWGWSGIIGDYPNEIDKFRYWHVLINKLRLKTDGSGEWAGWILYIDREGYLWLQVFPKNCNYDFSLGRYVCEQNGYIPNPSNPNVRYPGRIRSLGKLKSGDPNFITILFASGHNSNSVQKMEPNDTVEMFVDGVEQARLYMRPSQYKDTKNEWDNNADLRIGPAAYNGTIYMDDIKWTSVDNSLITAETAHKYRYLNSEVQEEFLPPDGQFSFESSTDTSLLLHLDATTKKNQPVDKLEKGNYGLCTFNPLTLQTENIHKFSKPQYKSTILSGAGNENSKNIVREYSLPRDIVYSPYENSLLMLFHEHKQNYFYSRQWIAGAGYGGGGGSSTHTFQSTSSFVLYKYDIEARNITSSESLWTRSWDEDIINAGYLVIDLIEKVAGLNNQYFSFPTWLYHMFTSLSMNPRSGEALALHSKGGFGKTNSYRNSLSEKPENWVIQDHEDIHTKMTAQTTSTQYGKCPTGRKCLDLTSYYFQPLWKIGKFGTPWRFSLFQNGGLDNISATSLEFESNNCLEFCDQGGSKRGDGSGTNFKTGITPRKSIFCPSTNSYYPSSNDDDANICFMYDNLQGLKEMASNYLIHTDGIIQDVIYVPSQDLMLYLIYNKTNNQMALTYVTVCKPGYELSISPCDTMVPLTEPIDLNSAQSLTYCPSNDKIYILGESTLLQVRSDNLKVENSFVVPTGNKILTERGLKAFIPMYSHVNDTIYFFSNDIDRKSFLFEPNY